MNVVRPKKLPNSETTRRDGLERRATSAVHAEMDHRRIYGDVAPPREQLEMGCRAGRGGW